MQITNSKVAQIIELENSINLIKVHCPEIALSAAPGQFCNIKVSESTFPLLRRPFSICDVDGEFIYFMFNLVGEGTKLLAHKKIGEELDILGPLGNGFNYNDDYEAAVFVGGGLGVAPFPFLLQRIPSDKKIFSFIGGRSAKDVITYGQKNYLISTDDGSKGFKGNVIELLNENLKLIASSNIKIFGCGPTPMLRALKDFAIQNNLNCEVSTECAMACGFGICQGCPIQAADKEGYYLVCKDGPVFDVKKVVI
ncbi:MAG: dihydroorotate dehydrogenase electron transfer subunit [Bacteroidota bacterium]|nr:dihydroorotate dehydrogenase electron transfer subunit [Bacteroidota bacterium]MDP4191964.1 dihydroorotate dehydrogenase electron transfer subunit [Bacteroidota bacterium]MDP4193582.1 dihydroorotate dehydrogenase electron transfer subunit [Bacteroidota bacterium]